MGKMSLIRGSTLKWIASFILCYLLVCTGFFFSSISSIQIPQRINNEQDYQASIQIQNSDPHYSLEWVRTWGGPDTDLSIQEQFHCSIFIIPFHMHYFFLSFDKTNTLGVIKSKICAI